MQQSSKAGAAQHVQRTVVHQLRVARERAGLSQRALAGRLSEFGLSLDPSAITRMETGDREVKAVELALIARALEVSVDDLVGAGEQSPEARLAALARSVVHNIDQARDLLEDALSELAQASILVREHPEIAPSTTSYLDSVASSFEREDPPYVVLTTREDRDAMRRLLTTLVNSFTLVVAPPQDQDHGERREAP